MSDDENQIQEALIEELGFSGLAKDKQEESFIKMTEVLLKRIFVETMEKLSEADREEYERMVVEKINSREVSAFLRDRVYNYDEMVNKIISDFKEEMKK